MTIYLQNAKAELANIIELKLRATLPADKMQKLEKTQNY